MAEGYHDFTAGETLTAANLEDYCQNQSAMRFASAAARDSALSAVKTEGMLAYLLDTNTLTVYSGSAWSTIGPVHGARTSHATTITQSGAVTYTSNTSTYARVGRTITWNFVLSVTGSGTGANVITLTLPAASAYSSDYQVCGSYILYDSSATTTYHGPAVVSAAGTLKFLALSSGAVSVPTFLGASGFTAALASGDVVSGFITYEAAADA